MQAYVYMHVRRQKTTASPAPNPNMASGRPLPTVGSILSTRVKTHLIAT